MKLGSGTDKEVTMKRLIIAMMIVLFATTVVYGQSAERMKTLFNEGMQFYHEQDFRQAAQKWEQALEIARTIRNKGSEGALLMGLGGAYNKLGDYAKAISYYEQALKIHRELGDKKSVAMDLTRLGSAYDDLRDYQKAISYYQESLNCREIADVIIAGINLTRLGLAYYNLNDYHNAISYYEQALEIHRELGDKKSVATDLMGLTSVYDNLRDYQKAIFYYEQALKIYRETEDKKNLGLVYLSLGVACTKLGDYTKAISYCEQALKIHRELGDKKFLVATDLMGLGGAYISLGDYQKAISYLEQALKIHRELGDKKSLVATDLMALGYAYISLGDYRRAIPYFEQAMKIHRKYEDIDIGSFLGHLHARLRNYARAISYYEQAMKIHRKLGDEETLPINLRNLGAVYSLLGDYQKGLSYCEQALKIHRELGDKKLIAIDLRGLGAVYGFLGDYQKGLSYCEQALKIHRELGDKELIATDLISLGNFYYSFGDYQKAISYHEQAMKIHSETAVADAEVGIAHSWLDMGKVQEAEEIFLRLSKPGPIGLGKLNLVKRNYRKAVEYFNKSLERDLQSRHAASLFADYTGLGQAYEGLKEYHKARHNYEKTIAMSEEQRETLAEAEKSRFFTAKVGIFKHIQPYEGMVRVLIDMDSSEDAFFYSENLKARVLVEAIARRQSELEYTLPSELAKEENAYITQIRGLRRQMEALYRNKAMDTYYERERELKAVKAKQQEFIRRLRARYPEYASIHYPQPIKPDEVKLKPNEVLIEFEVTDEATYVLMLKEGKLKTRRVPISRQALQELVLQYRGFFEGITKTSQLLEYKPEVGKKLYALLFGDLLQPVAEGSTLIIVPDEFLGILPFEALVTDLPAVEKIGDGEYGPFPLGVRYLGDRYLVSYAQSATSLTLLRTLKKGRASGEGILVVADPIFSVNDTRLRRIAQAEVSKESLTLMGAIADWKQMGVARVRAREKPREAGSVADEIFPRLEKTEELARKMESLFGNRAKVLLGADAREDKVVGTSLPEYRYLVFATHGILDNAVPWIREPALVLTQVGNPEGYDGFLTMTEVMGLKLEADVVALTACETGVGKNVSGEGVMGMGRAFQFAGTGNVLMSLWSVAELSATQFTTAFFKHLKEGKEPRQAMRLARSAIRRQGYEHPFYWASFILLGR